MDRASRDDLAVVTDCIREISGLHTAPDEDFYDAGFPSLQALELLLQLEERWCVTIPDSAFIAARSARALAALRASAAGPIHDAG